MACFLTRGGGLCSDCPTLAEQVMKHDASRMINLQGIAVPLPPITRGVTGQLTRRSFG